MAPTGRVIADFLRKLLLKSDNYCTLMLYRYWGYAFFQDFSICQKCPHKVCIFHIGYTESSIYNMWSIPAFSSIVGFLQINLKLLKFSLTPRRLRLKKIVDDLK